MQCEARTTEVMTQRRLVINDCAYVLTGTDPADCCSQFRDLFGLPEGLNLGGPQVTFQVNGTRTSSRILSSAVDGDKIHVTGILFSGSSTMRPRGRNTSSVSGRRRQGLTRDQHYIKRSVCREKLAWHENGHIKGVTEQDPSVFRRTAGRNYEIGRVPRCFSS